MTLLGAHSSHSSGYRPKLSSAQQTARFIPFSADSPNPEALDHSRTLNTAIPGPLGTVTVTSSTRSHTAGITKTMCVHGLITKQLHRGTRMTMMTTDSKQSISHIATGIGILKSRSKDLAFRAVVINIIDLKNIMNS